MRSFDTVEELRLALHEWLKLYNEEWLIERHGHRTPASRSDASYLRKRRRRE